jgi:hypothetical protein
VLVVRSKRKTGKQGERVDWACHTPSRVSPAVGCQLPRGSSTYLLGWALAQRTSWCWRRASSASG